MLDILPYHIIKNIYYQLHRLYMRDVCREINTCIFFVMYRETKNHPYKLSWWYARNQNYYYCLELTCD